MRNNKGITLVALIITIIIVIILAGISIGSINSKNSINESKSDVLISELNQVQQIILETYTKYLQTENEGYLIGNKCSQEDIQELNNKYKVTINVNDENYYIINSKQLEVLGINGSTQTYIINYTTGAVFNNTTTVTQTNKELFLKDYNSEIN